MPRAIHFDPDPDDHEQDRVFCGTEGEFERHHFTCRTERVTCKRCLKILARFDARRAAATMKSKAAAWDRMFERANQIGYTDPWDALAELCRQKGLPVFAEF